jgi:putative hemin transport protein
MSDPDSSDLRARHDALVAEQPKLRMRERAGRLGTSEAELVAAGCGVESVELGADSVQALFRGLGALGELMALSRNDWCVHERHGAYLDIQAEGPVGLVLGPDIDLRVFFGCWRFAYAVTENGRQSLQFFDLSGEAVHKVYRTEATDGAAWDAFIARFAQAATTPPQVHAAPPPDVSDRVDDPAALRAHWLGMTDTHEFFPMLRKFRISRLAALCAGGADLAQRVPADAVESVLQSAAASGLSIMCFVGNRGIVQIHTGPVHKLVRTGPWFNVLDAAFNLHLNTAAITSCWVVNKPTSDGWVTSLEAYAGGELIVQFFGERKPGKPELPAWRELMLGLCAQPLAA